MEKKLIARWASHKGKIWVELYYDDFGYSYNAPGAGGVLPPFDSDESAIRYIEYQCLWYLTPDSHKNLLKRIL